MKTLNFSARHFLGMSLASTLSLALFPTSTVAQTSYLAGSDVAVFYPAQFESGKLMPSFIFTNELCPVGEVPQGWTLRPQFSSKPDGTKVITIDYGEADLYGNGEVIGNLRRNGTEFTTWNTDNYVYSKFGGRQLYQSHPYVMGVRPDGSCFAVIVDGTYRMHFTLGSPMRIETKGPMPRVVVMERPNPSELLKVLGEYTGTMDLPPLWALGYQQCRFSYYPEQRVQELADRMRRDRIPCDVIWFDIDYMDGFRVFTFDDKKFPSPKRMNDYLHDRQFKAVYMIDPGVKAEPGYAIYDEGLRRQAFMTDSLGREYTGRVWPGQCVFPDFMQPGVRSWWSSLYGPFMATGIDGVWNDMNEPAVFDTPEMTMPESNLHVGGDAVPAGPHSRYHNVYGMQMVRASRQGILDANPQKRPFVLSRANFLGGQRYGATWTGDNASSWTYLRASIPMTINLSLSGQPFNGPDMCGFTKECQAQLFEHWMALGAYYPFARNHNASKTQDQEPWSFGPECEDVARTAINRRYRLMPYLYTLFYEASTEGQPVMRPVFMADASDVTLRHEQQCFLLGGDLLVIPRWASEPSLPSGDWDVLQLETTDDGVQPYVALRPGAIVPMGQLVQSTVEYSADSLTLLVNPTDAGAAQGTLYHDAGDGFGYRMGQYARLQFSCEPRGTKQLAIRMAQVGGSMPCPIKTWRVGYVTDGRIVYSPWQQGSEIVVKLVKDKQLGINLKKLKFTHFPFSQSKDLSDMLSHDKFEVGEGEDF